MARTTRKSARPPDPAPIARQAIVVIHGQGEQRPMGTIRDFVEVLWQYNSELDTPGADEAKPRPIWIVPDDKSGLYELQRVTTPPHNGRKSDFFELYYADLLNATPLRNLWRWLRRLLWIDPADVPDRMRLPWTVFWILTLVAIAVAVIAALAIPALLATDWFALLAAHETLRGRLIVLGGLLLLLLPKFVRPLSLLERIPVWVSVLIIAVGVLDISGWDLRVLAAMLLALLVYLADTFLLPYFGDAASYLSAQTETVHSRQGVRNRGLALLKALHDDPAYDRIVVIGHSLGSVLAYDLLHILWHEVGPTKDHPPGPEAAAALAAVDRFVAATPADGWTEDQVRHYQDLQWRAFDALRRERAGPERTGGCGWKISDFVSLGSPLSSAEFLITESRDDFARMKQERVLPTAPAQNYDADHGALYTDDAGRRVAHHGAVFSAVRWTNIYDRFESPLFLLGDPISGPVGGGARFGPGVWDINVAITWGRGPWRLFTHNFYWTDTAPEGERPAPHIKAFRKAVGLERPAPPQ